MAQQTYPNWSSAGSFADIASGENVSSTMVVGAGAQIVPDTVTPGIIAATNIQSIPVNPAVPTDQQVIKYDATSGTYTFGDFEQDIYLVAGENINSFQVVTVHSDGLAYIASADTIADCGLVVGIAISSALIGDPLTVRQEGEIDNIGWIFTAGDAIFVSLSGALSDGVARPFGSVFQQQVGVAQSVTTLLMQLGTPTQFV